jgi:hypothetical protein
VAEQLETDHAEELRPGDQGPNENVVGQVGCDRCSQGPDLLGEQRREAGLPRVRCQRPGDLGVAQYRDQDQRKPGGGNWWSPAPGSRAPGIRR